MFYHEDELSEIINCVRCKKRHVEPKIIVPCFNTLCVRCVQELTDESNIDCFFCKCKHPVPEVGFASDRNMESFLKLRPKEVHRNSKLIKELRAKLHELTLLLDDFSAKALGLESALYEHCAGLKNQIDLISDSKIQLINEIREKHLKHIDDYRESCLANINTNTTGINDEIKKYRTFFDECEHLMKSFEIEDDLVKEQTQRANFKIEELKIAVENLDYVKFNSARINFNPDENEIKSNFIGQFTSTPLKKILKDVNYSVISGSGDKTLKIWDLKTGECTKTLTGHTSYVICLVVVDERTIVSGSHDKTLKVWNLDDGCCLRTLTGHADCVYCLAVVDGTTLASGSWDKTIRIWNLGNEKCVRTFEGEADQVWCLCKMDNDRLASGSRDKNIKVWSLRDGKCIQTLIGHSKAVHCMSKLDNHRLVSGSYDKTLKLWDTQTGACLATLEEEASVYCVLTFDRQTIISGDVDGKIIIWKLDESEASPTCIKTLPAHSQSVRCLSLVRENTFLSGSHDQSIKVWNLDNFECVRLLKGHSGDICCASILY